MTTKIKQEILNELKETNEKDVDAIIDASMRKVIGLIESRIVELMETLNDYNGKSISYTVQISIAGGVIELELLRNKLFEAKKEWNMKVWRRC